MNIENHRILISPKANATQRTKNRIREHGAKGFILERSSGLGMREGEKLWLVRGPATSTWPDGWSGWLPKDEFHLEAWGEEFFVEKF